MKKRGLRKNENAQMGIDFLFGMSVFLSALVFLAVFIPGMFLPFHSETIDLNSVAYRTSVILVEDPGWYNGIKQGEDWENDIANVSRVGLAIDKKHPNMLALHKIEGFRNETLIDNKKLDDKLGLYKWVGTNKLYYGYNITIVDLNGHLIAKRGGDTPKVGDVSSTKRIVNAQTDLVYDLCGLKSMFPHQDDKADFNISSPENDLVLIIREIAVQNPPNKPQLNYIKINKQNQSQIELGKEYWVWVDNGTGDFEARSKHPITIPKVPDNASSRLKIVIDKNVFVDGEAFFPDGTHLIEMKFKGVVAEVGVVELDKVEKTPVYTNAVLRVDVW